MFSAFALRVSPHASRRCLMVHLASRIVQDAATSAVPLNFHPMKGFQQHVACMVSSVSILALPPSVHPHAAR